MNITAVITTCNRLQRLKKAVASVENQTLLPDELIIIDDNSCDQTQEYCKNLQEISKIPIIYSYNDFRAGSNVCRNQAIGRANGEYIAFLDDDDEWLPEKLQIQYETAKKDNADLVYTAVILSSRNNKKKYFHSSFPFAPKLAIMLGNFVGITSAMMVKSEVLRKTKGFNVDIPSLQDYELVIRLINSNAKVKGIATPLVKYGTADDKNISVSSKGFFEASKIILRKTPIFYRPLQFLGIFRIFMQKLLKSKQFRKEFLSQG